MTLVEINDVSKSFTSGRAFLDRRPTTTHALIDVTLGIQAGQTLGVVGESGSGKSTLGRVVLHLLQADTGQVVFDGVALSTLKAKTLRELRGKIQMIFQDPFDSLDQRMTIGDLVAEPMNLHGIVRGHHATRLAVAELLDRVGLRPDQMNRYPYEFSGGQLQRVAIARALATDPVFIVCDEPVAALDVSIRAQIINLLRDLQQERGLSYLFISHDLSLIKLIADQVAVLYLGRVVEYGPTADLYRQPHHPYTRALLEAIPSPDPAHRHLLSAPPTLLAAQKNEPEHGCAFAPRCPLATECCWTEPPPLVRSAEGVDSRCHHTDQMLSMTARST